MEIGLAVAGDHRATFEAVRYVRALPLGTHLYLWCAGGHTHAVRQAARTRGLSVSVCHQAQQLVRVPHLVVVFGEPPFSPHDIEKLAEQDVCVEIPKPSPTRGRARYDRAHR